MVRRVKNFYHLLVALFSVLYFRYPAKNLYVIGVTGTDGKTTTAHLIYEILKIAGKKVGLISTVVAKIGEKEVDTGLHITTPSPFKLQSILRKMLKSDIKYVVLEATSHGLDQYRLLGCNFKIGTLTNITHEHLDYHQTWSAYLKAKAKLFTGVEWGILNRDDRSYPSLIKIFKEKLIKHVSYGLKKRADLMAEEVNLTSKGLSFRAENKIDQTSFQIKSSLLGEYNLYNCLAAISAAQILEIENKIIKKAIKSFPSVAGRMQTIDESQNFKVIVDFAHTPNGLKQTLKTLSSLKPRRKKLMVVFGCAGQRDKQKRPLMGKVAAQLADLIVLTAEDPRTEDVRQIIEEIAVGALAAGAKEASHPSNLGYHSRPGPWLFHLPDRKEAIQFAVQKLAQKGDVVVICGKGHEKSMCLGKKEIPWSDEEVVRKTLKRLTL